MEYGKPQKLPDGRYFLKVSGARHQLNGLTLQASLSAKSVNFAVPDASLFKSVDEEIRYTSSSDSNFQYIVGGEVTKVTGGNVVLSDYVRGPSFLTDLPDQHLPHRMIGAGIDDRGAAVTSAPMTLTVVSASKFEVAASQMRLRITPLSASRSICTWYQTPATICTPSGKSACPAS